LTSCGWDIRLYKADDYKVHFDIVGNFKKHHDRQNDDVVVFEGMYGINDYFIWYIHKNIKAYDFSRINIDLSLFSDKNPNRTFWRRQYKVIEVKYDARISKYVLFGISLDSAKLQSKLVDYKVKSLNYSKDRGVYRQEPTKKEMLEKWEKIKKKDLSRKQKKKEYLRELIKVKKFGVLYDILEVNNIFKVEYMESPYEADLRNFGYRYFTFDEDWRVIDFINYIADQNEFEWYVRNGVLYIGNECKAIKGQNATRKFDLETDNISSSAWFKKYSGVTRPMEVMSHISEAWRCVWVKHMAGKSGGISKGCFTRIGIGTLDKETYLKTLEGEPERTMATNLFINKPYSHYIGLGNILKDEGNPIYVDEVSVQKNKLLYKVNEPSDVKIDRGNDSSFPLLQTKQRVSRSTPYLDAGGGIFFPSPLLEELDKDDEEVPIKGFPPNVIIFQVKGKEESSVIGPYVMGNFEGDFKNYKIPFKGRKDFRFSLPNGWTMYVDGDYGKLLFQCDGVPTWTDIAPSFPYPGDNDYNPSGQEKTYIYMRPYETEATAKRNEISLNAGIGKDGEEKGSKLRVRSDEGFYFITHTASTGNKTTIEAKKTSIKFETTNGTNKSTITLNNDGTIDIVGDGNINLNGAKVISQGGGHKLSHETHKHGYTHIHSIGNMGIPIPIPPSTIPGNAVETEVTTDNTTTTEAE